MQGPGDAPTKVFDRTPNLQGAQIISYRTSPDMKWSVLIGITAGAPERLVAAASAAQVGAEDAQRAH